MQHPCQLSRRCGSRQTTASVSQHVCNVPCMHIAHLQPSAHWIHPVCLYASFFMSCARHPFGLQLKPLWRAGIVYSGLPTVPDARQQTPGQSAVLEVHGLTTCSRLEMFTLNTRAAFQFQLTAFFSLTGCIVIFCPKYLSFLCCPTVIYKEQNVTSERR